MDVGRASRLPRSTMSSCLEITTSPARVYIIATFKGPGDQLRSRCVLASCRSLHFFDCMRALRSLAQDSKSTDDHRAHSAQNLQVKVEELELTLLEPF